MTMSNDNFDSLTKVIKIVSGGTGMQVGFDKCAVLKMKRGKQVNWEGIDLGDGVVIEEADEERCKSLGIVERNDICQEKMKEKVQNEYYKRIRAVLKSKLNSGNVIDAINVWAAGTVRYGTEIIYWNKAELDKIDQQTQKLLNMHRG